jgi:phosphate-selective porin O/P
VRSRQAVTCALGVLSFAARAAAQSQGGAGGASPPKVIGYVQARFQSIGDSARFLLRRAWLGAQGDLTPWASYRLLAELRTGGTTGTTQATVSAIDLYVTLEHGPWTATVGQSKTPLSLEFVRSAFALELPERAMPVDALAPNRDVGVKLEWTPAGAVAVQGGIFNGDGINRAGNQDKRFLYVGRAVVRPATRTYLGVSAAGKPDTTTGAVEAWADRGRVALRAEFLARHAVAADRTTLGWYALGAYAAIPKRLQLVGRVQQFDPNDRASGDRVTGYTGGAQYFFRADQLKAQLEYTVFAEQTPVGDNNRLIVQLQATF